MVSLTGLTAWAISLWSVVVSTAKCAKSHYFVALGIPLIRGVKVLHMNNQYLPTLYKA